MFYLRNWITIPVGEFMLASCEACGSEVFTVLLKRRRWVSFLSLPLVPTSKTHWYHQCPECGAAWELPDGCSDDAWDVREQAQKLLDGRITSDEYHAELESFVNEHGQVDYEEATKPDAGNLSYIQ